MSDRPDAAVLMAERFGDPTEDITCPKCHLRYDEPLSHMPEQLGGGCVFDGKPDTCPECSALTGFCESWCSLARSFR